MDKLKNGMKVKIKSTKREWSKCIRPHYVQEDKMNNIVIMTYQNNETCTVTNACFGKDGWTCDLLTKDGTKLTGFYLWELKRTLF